MVGEERLKKIRGIRDATRKENLFLTKYEENNIFKEIKLCAPKMHSITENVHLKVNYEFILTLRITLSSKV